MTTPLLSPETTPEIKDYAVCHSFNKDFINCLNRLNRQYGDEVFEVLGIANKNLDIARFSKEFFSKSASNVADVSVDDNANVSDKNVSHHDPESTKALQKLNSAETMYYWVKKCFGKKEADLALEKVINGEIFCNDFSGWSKVYCYSFDLRNLLYEGMSFFNGNMKIHPPKRSASFVALLVQSVAFISNQIMGAFSAPDVFCAWDYFLRKEFGPDYTKSLVLDSKDPISQEITNQFQNLIYSLNFPFRGAGQSAFTNFSVMDRGFMNSLFTKDGISGQDYIYPDNTKVNIDSVIRLSQFFFDYFTKINSEEGIFTFPVMTLAISKTPEGEFMDPSFVEWVTRSNSTKCLGNIYIGEPTSYSSCCRMKSDMSKIGSLGYQNSFGVSGLSIGSHRCVGLNLPRLAYLEKTNPGILIENLEVIHNILHSHRMLIKAEVERGCQPLYTSGWISLSRQYSTVGFLGMYEYLKNKGLDPTKDQDLLEGVKILRGIESKIVEWQQKDGTPWNVEQIPGESMCVRSARLDTLLGFNPNGYKLYSNQYLPLWEYASIYDRFRLQGKFDSLTSGGAILHITVQDSEPLSPKQFIALIEQARKSGTTYFAINLAFSECSKRHFSISKRKTCPVCEGDIVNYYTRVVGYLSKVQAWNRVRREQDFPVRYSYKNGQLEALKSEELTPEGLKNAFNVIEKTPLNPAVIWVENKKSQV